MSAIVQLLAKNGLMLLGGATVLLLAGALAAMVVRSPVVRQRICELSLLATGVWVVLACVPLPRVAWERAEIKPRFNQGELAVESEAIVIPPELISKAHAAVVARPSAPPPKQSITPTNPLDLKTLFAEGYIVGAAICVGWLALGYFLLWRMIRRSTPAPPQVMQLLESQAISSRSPHIRIVPNLARPITCGAIKPIILLPQSLLREDCKTQLRQALLHEKGHIQQRDGLGSLLFNTVLPLLYFHPLYWYLRRTSTLARELVVDDLAARADGKETYVSQLIALARTRAGTSLSPIGAIGILQPRSHFYRRMHMLLQRTKPLATRCSISARLTITSIAVAVVIAATAFIGVRPASAQSAAADPSQPDKIQKDRQAEFDELLAKKNAVEKELALLKAQQAKGAGGDGSGFDPREIKKRSKDATQMIDELTDSQIAMLDQNMRKLVGQRDALRQHLEELTQNFGPNHPTVIATKKDLGECEAKLGIYAAEWRDFQKKIAGAGGLIPGETGAPAKAGANPFAADMGRVGGVQIDLIQLGNSLIDATAALQLAKLKLSVAVQVENNGGKNELEVMTAKVNLTTAEKRLALLRGIAEISLRSAQDELNRQVDLVKKGYQSQEAVSDAKSKVQMLQMIIDTAH